MTGAPSPAPVEIMDLLARRLSFAALRKKFPRLSNDDLRAALKEAAEALRGKGSHPSSIAGKIADTVAGDGWVAYIDGASRGNPGPAGAGVCIHADGEKLELTRFLGRHTNNVAEYEALLLAMNTAADRGVKNLQIRSDSELLVKQMNGLYRVKNRDLSQRFIKAKNIEKKFKSFKITHVGRENNCDADRLANLAIDEAG